MTTDTQRIGRSRGRWKRLLAIVCIAVACVPVAARALYAVLYCNQSIQQCRVAILANASQECYDKAASLLDASRIDQLWVVDLRLPRAVRIGAMPSTDQRARRELRSRGVPGERIRYFPTDAATRHQMVRALDQLHGLPDDAQCAVIADAIASRRFRLVFDQSLSPARADRYRIHAVANPEDGPWTWWFKRASVRRVMNRSLRLAFLMLHGESVVVDNGLDRLLVPKSIGAHSDDGDAPVTPDLSPNDGNAA